MAEAAIAVVGLVMATYTTIDTLVKHTDLLADGLESHHDLKNAIQNLHAFRVEGARSQLRQELLLAQQLLKTTNDEETKTSLDNSFQDVQRFIIQVEDALKERGKLHGISPKTRARKSVKTEEVGVALKSLKAAKDLFTSITINTAMQTTLPSLHHLSDDDFKVIRELNSSEYKGSLPKETLLVKGNVGSSSARGIFLLEKRQTAEANVRSLAEILFRLAEVRKEMGSTATGILDCIGYRRVNPSVDDGTYHLVFTLPTNLELDKSLQDLLQSRSASTQTSAPSLNRRIGLCYQLSNAVLEVHKLGLVHKNINTVNILLMNPKAGAATATTVVASAASRPSIASPSPSATAVSMPHDSQGPTMFLADWHLVRKAANASSFQREKDWWKRLYQHPSRHLEDIEQKYTMYHDIYSLGVCMIEILLWESLLVKLDNQELGPSPLFESAVGQSSVQQAAHTGRSVTSLDGETVQAILIKIARTKLPSVVGTKLTGLVVSCLKCLEGGFGPISFSEKSMLTTISNFMTTIQKDLWDVKLAL